jgi:pyruvate,water dikinase
LVRYSLLEIGSRAGIGDLVFHLTLSEAGQLAMGEDVVYLTRTAEHRRTQRSLLLDFDAVEDADELNVATLERLGRARSDVRAGDDLAGLRASGVGEVIGQARLINIGDELPDMQDGEIIVSTYTDTSLAPLFRRAGGLVTEVGGMLSHAAIVARELGLPAVVGVRGITRRVRTGDTLRLTADGRIDVLHQAHGASIPAHIGEVSPQEGAPH